jgi:hypothetical protein
MFSKQSMNAQYCHDFITEKDIHQLLECAALLEAIEHVMVDQIICRNITVLKEQFKMNTFVEKHC